MEAYSEGNAINMMIVTFFFVGFFTIGTDVANPTRCSPIQTQVPGRLLEQAHTHRWQAMPQARLSGHGSPQRPATHPPPVADDTGTLRMSDKARQGQAVQGACSHMHGRPPDLVFIPLVNQDCAQCR